MLDRYFLGNFDLWIVFVEFFFRIFRIELGFDGSLFGLCIIVIFLRTVFIFSLLLLVIFPLLVCFEISSVISVKLFLRVFDELDSCLLALFSLLKTLVTVFAGFFVVGLSIDNVTLTSCDSQLKPLKDLSEG